MKKMIEAWKLTPRNPPLRNPVRPEPFWIVRYDDDTGNMVNPDGTRLFRDTTLFDHEPIDYLDDVAYYRIHPVLPGTVPGAAR